MPNCGSGRMLFYLKSISICSKVKSRSLDSQYRHGKLFSVFLNLSWKSGAGEVVPAFPPNSIEHLNFSAGIIYSEKATKFCEIFPLLLTAVHRVKGKGMISQNFVAFSEYMNFIKPLRLKQTFPPIIWIFIEGEGDGIKSRLPFESFFYVTSKFDR